MNFFVVIWILTVYSVALAVLSPILGKYSDMAGRRVVYRTGYLIFLVGSIMAGLSPNALIILVARMLQGAGAACLFSNSLAIITDAFKGAELQRAMGINAAVVGFGTAIGPIVGGALTQITWRLIFLANTPIAALGYALSRSGVAEEMRVKASIKMDWAGSAVFSTLVTILIVYLTLSPIIGWTGITIAMPMTALVLIAAFIYIEGRTENPIINPSIFKNKKFSPTITSTLLNSITRYSLILLLALYLQGPAGYSPLETGVLMTPYAVAMGLSSFFAPNLVRRVSSETLEIIGLFLIVASAFALAMSPIPYVYAAIAMSIGGAGMGLFYTPNNTAIMLSVEPMQRGVAAGLRTLMLNLGSAIGTALTFAVLATEEPMQLIGNVFLGLSTSLGYRDKLLFTRGIDILYVIIGAMSLLTAFLIIVEDRRRK